MELTSFHIFHRHKSKLLNISFVLTDNKEAESTRWELFAAALSQAQLFTDERKINDGGFCQPHGLNLIKQPIWQSRGGKESWSSYWLHSPLQPERRLGMVTGTYITFQSSTNSVRWLKARHPESDRTAFEAWSLYLLPVQGKSHNLPEFQPPHLYKWHSSRLPTGCCKRGTAWIALTIVPGKE